MQMFSKQVIHVDYDLSLEEPYSEIYYSSLEELPVKFNDKFTSFENICIETCSLSLSKDSYKLIIEIENTALKIDEIEYTLGGRITNELPLLIKDIEDINIIENKNYTLDLNKYFFDPDNDKLAYDYFETDNITIKFEDNFAYVIPDTGFVGNRFSFIYANDSFGEIISNVFSINITKEQIIRSKVVIDKPVKWLKKVKFDKITNNATVNITSFATNITVRKIKDNILEEVLEENIKIKQKGVIKNLREYEMEKSLEKIKDIIELTEVIINDLVEEIEIEYYTDGPTSKETKISSNRKLIVISSDIHYKNILAFTNLPIEANSEAIRLFWLINDTRIEVNVDKFDTNGNNLIDYIEWIVPSLSNQTYEVEITILNVQSFPTLFGNWTVRFNTSGTGNLTITATNGTSYSEIYEDNSTTTDDLSILELKCGNEILFSYYDNINNDNVYLINENARTTSGTNSVGNEKLRLNETLNKNINIKSIYVENYNCSGMANWTVKVITSGKHTQQFNFSNQIAYAFNTVASDVCDEGTADTLCVVNTIHGVTNNSVLYFHNLTIQNGGALRNQTLTAVFNISANNIIIEDGGYIEGSVNINASNLTILTGGFINVTGKGFSGGSRDIISGKGPGGGGSPQNSAGGGAGYGGDGGKGINTLTAPGSGGSSYGLITRPTDLGSGGGGGDGNKKGGDGGGTIFLNITDTLIVNGTINASGEKGQDGTSDSSNDGGGGGSGGSIYIITNTFVGNGSIEADGGDGGEDSGGTIHGGGGGGGRIALYYTTNSYSGNLNARAGVEGGGSSAETGGAGTIFIKPDSQTYGNLTIDNGGNSGVNTTIDAVYTFASINLTGSAKLEINNTNITTTKFHPITSATFFLADNANLTINDGNLSLDSSNLTMGDGVTLTIVNLIAKSSSTITNNGNLTPTNLFLQSSSSITNNGNFTINTTYSTETTTTITNNAGAVIITPPSILINNIFTNFGSITGPGGVSISDINLTGTLTQNKALNLSTFLIKSGGILTHSDNSVTQIFTLNITAVNLTVLEADQEIILMEMDQEAEDQKLIVLAVVAVMAEREAVATPTVQTPSEAQVTVP